MPSSLLPQLQVFLEVARKRSFSGAARELGVSTSAVSQSIRQLEEALHVTLLVRTTRSVSLTDAGKRLVESAGPALGHAQAALAEVSAKPGEAVGRLRLTVPRIAVGLLTPLLVKLRERHPRVEVEVLVEDRLVDIVADGFDAGVRLSEMIERDMVQVRLTAPFRFVVTGAPAYLERRGTPQRPEDLLHHECLTLRSSRDALYAWELERGRRTWRVPVRGGVVSNDADLRAALAEAGAGLVYVPDFSVERQLRSGKLKVVLEAYAAEVPGFFLYFPSRAQKSPALRLFVETVREGGATRA
jgi:DNA-binding transcriptional LysR family regulator